MPSCGTFILVNENLKQKTQENFLFQISENVVVTSQSRLTPLSESK